MPKIVDREEFRKEIGIKSIEIFREHGYKSLSMRKLCQLLGMSKSGLYHYFANKTELFIYCGELLFSNPVVYEMGLDKNKQDNLISWIKNFENHYLDEIKLLIDFKSDSSIDEEIKSNIINKALKSSSKSLGKITGKEDNSSLLNQIYGALLISSITNNSINYSQFKI
jgi:AcrR family transcriptional regulator